MKTLIELYDERPIENVLATEVFQPEKTVFLCPAAVAGSSRAKDTIRRYFRHRGLSAEPVFLETNLYSSAASAKQLRAVIAKYPDCVADVTGGTDASLFACGTVCAESGIPAFTYSRRMNRFYPIHNDPFPEPLPCTVEHTVEDCFLMAGGALRKGRVDNRLLSRYSDCFDPFFRLYLRHRTEWKSTVSYIQQASQTDKNQPIPLTVDAPYTVKGERGSRISAPEAVLRDLASIGFLSGLEISRERVCFRFHDLQIRAWLRDVGSVLELYVYQVCVDSGLFCDVRSSAVVDWEGSFRQNNVTNEIDVMAMHGILPVFVSCKTCDITTEALNELAILRDRFGGQGAVAVIVTTQHCRGITRHRASELGIEVTDLDDLKSGLLPSQLRTLLQPD